MASVNTQMTDDNRQKHQDIHHKNINKMIREMKIQRWLTRLDFNPNQASLFEFPFSVLGWLTDKTYRLGLTLFFRDNSYLTRPAKFNCHVAGNAKWMSVRKPNDSTKYEAMCHEIDPDCDLALPRVKEITDTKSEHDVLRIINQIEPHKDFEFSVHGMSLSKACITALVKRLKGHTIEELDLRHCTKENLEPLLHALRENKIQCSNLFLGPSVPRHEMMAIAKSNHSISQIGHTSSYDGEDHVLFVNQYVKDWESNYLGKVLELDDNLLSDCELDAVGQTIQSGRYQRIHMTNDEFTDDRLKQWTHHLRQVETTTHVTLNFEGTSLPLIKAFKQQLYINQGIYTVFGGNYSLFSRNFNYFAFLGGNTFYSTASTVGASFAASLGWGAVGVALVGGMRALTNYYYHQQLLNIKSEHYFCNPSLIENFLVGGRASREWSAWFNWRSWTTDGYLGYNLGTQKIDFGLTQFDLEMARKRVGEEDVSSPASKLSIRA